MQPTNQVNTGGGIPPTPLKGGVASTSPLTQTTKAAEPAVNSKDPEPAVSSKVPEPVEGPISSQKPQQPQPTQSVNPPVTSGVSTGSTSATTATSAAPVVRPRGATSSISIISTSILMNTPPAS